MPKRSTNDTRSQKSREEFGRRLAASMAKRGVSQSELGRRLKVHKSAVSQWIHGTKTPSLDNLIGIADTLDESVSFLVPDRLAGRDSISALSQALGARLGQRLLVACTHLEDETLIRHLEAAIGEHYRVHGAIPSTPRRAAPPRKRSKRS